MKYTSINTNTQIQEKEEESDLKDKQLASKIISDTKIDFDDNFLHLEKIIENEDFLEAVRKMPAEMKLDYTPEQAKKDLNKLKEAQRKFKEEDIKMISTAFERSIILACTKFKWLGKDAFLWPSNDFDDYVNHTDMMVSFDSKKLFDGPILALDATFGVRGINSKIEQIKSEIERGQLTELKYFTESGEDFKPLYAPRIVIGMEKDRVLNFLNVFGEEFDKKKKAEDMDFLSSNAVRSLIPLEIKKEAEHFKNYALELVKNNIDTPNDLKEKWTIIAGAYDLVLNEIEKILSTDEKQKELGIDLATKSAFQSRGGDQIYDAINRL
ncbi:MAG: hypothetical protein US50_C0004G0039 [Candidatus Nomurabacteria bacterium GW2011_GWB1_37_5]|uniref:Uncharacterized protein n=1 Tax=Candidatus Nomurabacteria bacterium GW2011_GWB1_37_5 TaxID=1618742 RepID=A0A0G0HBE3_9BACT|nr:MAG: hypothetical protein US50_C0004G0039 [Candidatus Nomurabacteria bacterium GW2011_GWB1_37_5]